MELRMGFNIKCVLWDRIYWKNYVFDLQFIFI